MLRYKNVQALLRVIFVAALAQSAAAHGVEFADEYGNPLGPDDPAVQLFERGGVVFPTEEGGAVVADPGLFTRSGESTEDRARRIVETLVAGPNDRLRMGGAVPVFPEGTELVEVSISDANVVMTKLRMPQSFLDGIADGTYGYNDLSYVLKFNFEPLDIAGYNILVHDPESDTFQPIGMFETPPDFSDFNAEPDWAIPPPQPRSASGDVETRQFPDFGSGRPSGFLTDHRVYLNAGHGWTWRSGTNWTLQRGFVHNNIEDFSNADLVHQYVTQYLYNAGADVFNVREIDPNPNMVIVDNDDGAPDYVEWGTGWGTSSLAGYRNIGRNFTRTSTGVNLADRSSENPFTFGTNRLVQCVVGEPTATATWIPTIPEAGFYNVYVSHSAFSNRSPQAQYFINHAGGTTEYRIDQRRNRFTWIFLGRYYFEAGRDEATASVTLTNSSSSASHYVSADAVRFGGGTNIISRNGSSTTHPRYDEDASYHIQFSGAPGPEAGSAANVHFRNSADENAGWSGRPRFGAWLNTESTRWGAPSQPAVQIANHTNATAAGTARGTISYLSSGLEGTIHDTFRQTVHARVVANLRNAYGGDYVENSNPLRSGSFGEASSINSGGIPIFLGEWLFHDNARDMAIYHDPQFRRIMARGIYQGIAQFFANQAGVTPVFLPEPPRNFRVRALANGDVRLDWIAPSADQSKNEGHPATGYKLYTSTHGFGFPAGESIPNSTTRTVSGLEPGTTYYFKLTATNAGGESFPTETLAVRIPNGNSPALDILVVNGFDKMDTATRVQTLWNRSPLYRQFPDRMNANNYIVEHARAIDAWSGDARVSSASFRAVQANQITLSDFDTVIWMGGLQAETSNVDPTDDTALLPNMRSQLTTFVNGGGNLFMSGAEVGWDLARINQSSFMQNTLRFNHLGNGTETLVQVSGTPGSIFDGLEGMRYGQGSGSRYRVYTPDIIAPAGGSVAALEYGGPVGLTLIDGFEAIGGWRQPGFSGQTNADDASSFGIVGSPVRSGSGSGRLEYVWGSGDFIRLFNQTQPSFTASSDFSIWVHGDNSGNRIRIALRDVDDDIFVNSWTVIDWTGWREIRWEDVQSNPGTFWAGAGNGQWDGPTAILDSIQLQRNGGPASGAIHFDDATYRIESGGGSTGPVAGIQYEGASRVVHLGFPFETVADGEDRAALMTRVLDFFQVDVAPSGWMLY